MSHDPYPKDDYTETLRILILTSIPEAEETSNAEASLTTLSFRSRTVSNRHVWIETKTIGNIVLRQIRVDLEDWCDEQSWDNAVARLVSCDITVIRNVVQTWLSGGEKERCLSLGAIPSTLKP
jgi:hypothetical protein